MDQVSYKLQNTGSAFNVVQIPSKSHNRIEIKTEQVEDNDVKLEALHHSIDIKEESSILETEMDREYEGQICLNKSQLLKLEESHGSVKIFKCEICDYKSSRKGTLKIHLRIHTGEKPFTCEICNLTFSQKHNLKNHIRSHTGEKPFACEVCDYRSSKNGDLKIHLRRHTGEKPYSCEICDYHTITKAKLNVHLKIHTEEKPYVCQYCFCKFPRKQPYKNHLRIHRREYGVSEYADEADLHI